MRRAIHKDVRETMGTMLVEERERSGLSQRLLARRAGLLPEIIAQIESGRRVPSNTMIERIGRALQQSEPVKSKRATDCKR